MAKSKRPSAKTGDTIDGDTIDGDAVEKSVDQTAPPHASKSKHSQTAPPPSGFSSGHSSNAGSLITFAALALSILAVGLAGFAVWQQRQNTADIVALMPVSNSDAMESANITNLEPNNSGPSSSEESSSDLADRLTALESQLAADRQSQQSALAGLQDQMATPPPAADNSQNNDFGSDAKADIAAIRNDMDQRFAALEAALANQALPVKAGEDASDNADSQPAACGLHLYGDQLINQRQRQIIHCFEPGILKHTQSGAVPGTRLANHQHKTQVSFCFHVSLRV